MGRSCPGPHRIGCYRPPIEQQVTGHEAAPRAKRRSSGRATWWVSFAIFGVLAGLWAVTTPLGVVPTSRPTS